MLLHILDFQHREMRCYDAVYELIFDMMFIATEE